MIRLREAVLDRKKKDGAAMSAVGINGRWMRMLVGLAVCGCLMTGCEDSSSSSSGASKFGDNNPNVVAALGDSVTAGSEISGPSFPQIVAEMSGKTVINEAFGGALSSDGLAQIGELLARVKPGYIFILYGINDIIHIGNDDWTIDNLKQMIQIAKQNKTNPIVGTIPPRYSGSGTFNPLHQELNRRIRILCKAEGARVADVEREFGDDVTLMQADGFHPNENGNLIIATVFYEALR
jgi:lysophospholipase L1-like esterase